MDLRPLFTVPKRLIVREVNKIALDCVHDENNVGQEKWSSDVLDCFLGDPGDRFGQRFRTVRILTREPKRMAKKIPKNYSWTFRKAIYSSLQELKLLDPD